MRNRKTTRLQNYDYSQNGYYYITICVKNRECSFGRIENDKMILSDLGCIADKCWQEIPEHFPFVRLDVYIIMPDHVHGIIIIDKNVWTQDFVSMHLADNNNKFGPQSKNLASIVRGYKVGVKKWAVINNIDFNWQSRYYDHIVRDENDLQRIRDYILNNIYKWNEDDNNPLNDKEIGIVK